MKSQETKYQIFLSSTYEDLKDERTNIVETILKMYHFPVGMEMFSADNESQWNIIQSTINTSDIYILILGYRYGSLTKEKISYTQKEFNYAKKIRNSGNIEILCFIKDKGILTEPYKYDNNDLKRDKLEKFIDEVKNCGLTVEWWKNTDDLCKKVSVSLSKTIGKLNIDKNIVRGWVRKQNAEHQIQVVRDFLYSSSHDFETENNEVDTYRVDRNGHCYIERERTQLCLNDVTHGFTKYLPDKKGNSRFIDAISMETGNELQHLIYENNNGILSYFILFDKVVKKGESIKYKSNAYVENYLSDLVEKGIGYISIRPFAKTKYSNKKDILTFPKIKLFSKLSVTLIQIESGKKILQKIKPINTKSSLVFGINYGELANSCDIIVEIKL